MNSFGRMVIGVSVLATLTACQMTDSKPANSTNSSGAVVASTPAVTVTPTPPTPPTPTTTPTTASPSPSASTLTAAPTTTVTSVAPEAANPPVLPAVPQNLAATAGNATVAIRWAVSAGAATYNVQRGTSSSGPYTTLATPATANYTDSTVTNKTKYYYVVAAVNVAGQSADSAEVAATPTAPAPPPTTTASGGVSRPSYNTGTGLFVLNGVLYDSRGVPFVINGLNIDDAGSSPEPGMSNANANAVRYNVYQVFDLPTMVSAANSYITYDQVPILTVQNLVGPSDAKLSGDTNLTDLQNVVAQWNSSFSALSTAPLAKHMILNIANEWGPADSTAWRDAYIAAVTSLRNAGYTCPLMIDAGGYGQDPGDLLNYAAAVFNADPQKNIIFTIHLYNSAASALGGNPNVLQQLAALSASEGMVFAVMEFGPAESVLNATNISAAQVIEASRAAGLGWAAWAWDDPTYALTNDPYQMTVTQGSFTGSPATAATSSQLTAYGQTVVPYFSTAAKETDFP